MSVILLVRHGQASFGTDDYDRLSPRGVSQSLALGAALAGQGVLADCVVAGAMRRQRETASALVEGAGWGRTVAIDPDWDEFDVVSFLQGRVDGAARTDSRVFQGVLEDAMRAWVADDAGHGESETFPSFADRVEAALQRLVTRPSPSGLTIVATSAGTISWIVTRLLGGGVEQWIRLNRVCVNAAVTKLVCGRGGVSLVSFNEHGHLSGKDVTYR